MKTQISRDGFRPDRRYSGVYQQQGRMITDRDWNELVDILKTRVDEALVDVIGTGTPKGRAVTVQMAGNTPRLVPGYVYAGGLAGFVEPVPDATFPFGLHQQKGFPSAPPLPPAGTAYRLYADVWERPVVSLEDEDLRDLALHGADTCTRTQVMAQIKTCPVALDPRFLPGAGSGLLTLRFPAEGGQLDSDPCDPQTQEVDPVGGDFLFRLEVHDVRWPAGGDPDLPERVVVKWSRENGAEQFAFKDAPDWFSAGPWIYELHTVESEQHLGYHVPALGNNQSWAPKRGTLVAPLPTTAPEGTLVRRWDGYLVLVQSGGVWSVSSVNGETADVTAPGATVTFQTVQHGEFFRAAAKIALADLEILLEVEGAVFLPGDYWSAPVRRAAHEAGKELLTEAFPTGIVHRYVPLAEVQTNGQLRVPNATEQRRLAFPRLTELDAGDMGYTTNCGSGLFSSTHDTVKKALDRLCEIAAQHVSYTKPQGGDTSIFKGNNPLTVRQALDLLADVKADDILYTTTKDSSVGNVHQALDALFDRQAGSGNRFTVGTGGDFGSIADAISELHGQESVALALMPGVHALEGFDIGSMIPGARLSIQGLGLGSQIRLIGDFDFSGLAMVELDNVAIEVQEEGEISFRECPEISLKECWIERTLSFSSKPLMTLDVNDSAGHVLISGCLLDLQPTSESTNLHILEGLNEDIPDLYAVGLSNFLPRVKTLVAGIADLSQSQRTELGQMILRRLPTGSLNREQAACHEIGRAIEIGSFRRENLEAAFDRLRRAITFDKPGTALVLQEGRAMTRVEGNDIRGRIGLYGPPAHIQLDVSTAWSRQKSGINTMGARGGDLHLHNNRVVGIRVSDSMIQWIQQFNPNNTPVVFDFPINNLVLSDNRIDGLSHTLVARNVKLNSTTFTGLSTDGWILGETGVYVGTLGEVTTPLIAVNDLTKAASAVGTLRFAFNRFA